jgi:hypothetical protein
VFCYPQEEPGFEPRFYRLASAGFPIGKCQLQLGRGIAQADSGLVPTAAGLVGAQIVLTCFI